MYAHRPLAHVGCFLLIGAVAISSLSPLQAQEEPDRPAGEVTEEMAKRAIPPEWVGAGAQPPGMGLADEALPAPDVVLPRVFPTPQEAYRAEREIAIGSGSTARFDVELVGDARRLEALPGELRKRIATRLGVNVEPSAAVRFVFALNARDLPVEQQRMDQVLSTLDDPEGYTINAVQAGGQDVVLVLGKSDAALWRALATLSQLFERRGESVIFPTVDIVDYPHMKRRGLIVDIGGQGFMVASARWSFDQWKEFVDWMVDQKLNEMWIEIIGSGRLMGNLDPAAGEWIGFPLELKSYPQLVLRDRPIRRWDASTQQVVSDRYTAPNVTKEFARELIDYAQARGVKTLLLIGYDYFANQLPFTLGVPANDPSHPEANKVYDTLLREIVERYDNASGVVFITIENKNVPPSMVNEVIRRMHEGRAIVKSINPRMEVGVLNDYLEWRPREEFDRFAAGVPDDLYQVYAPHTQPQNKSWKRIYGDVVRYELFSQYAWNHVAYIFPERVKREIQESLINGYRDMVSQGWYADVFKLNYATMAQMAWNSTGVPLEHFWTETLVRTFGPAAAPHMRTALAHTRFDIRSDIVSRMIISDYVDRTFRFWDMYNLTNIEGLKDPMLAALEEDARASLDAAQVASPHVTTPEAREMVDVVITSAERRLYLATSARHLLHALAAEKAGNATAAAAAMEKCMEEAGKLTRASTKLGIEYPMATHDDEVVEKYRQIQARILKR